MDATPISFDAPSLRPATATAPAARSADAIARQWAMLHEAAAVVAALAGVADTPGSALRRFPGALRKAPHGRRALAEQAIEDLAAIMEPGLAALLAVHRRGGDASAPAAALWEEFATARATLIGLVTAGD
jgi:hypothetical protein